ncbi:MAG: winged helix-turn-helix domain-containing protein, partial [Myxococcota bacterium]
MRIREDLTADRGPLTMPDAPPTAIELGSGTLDLTTGALATDRGPVTLTPIERALVRYLWTHRHRTVTRDELLTEVWGYREGVHSRTAEVAIGRLRAKIEPNPSAPRHVLTVRGEGYTFGAEPAVARPGPRVADRPVPRLLEALIGRARELRAIRAAWADGARWLTLTGPPGVGKTWVARAALTEIADAHRSEVLFVDLHRVITGVELEAVLDQALGEPLDGWLAREASAVLVLDGADALDTDAAVFAQQRLQRHPRLSVLATAHAPIGVEGERVLGIPSLSDEDGAALLRRRLADAALPEVDPDVLAALKSEREEQEPALAQLRVSRQQFEAGMD